MIILGSLMAYRYFFPIKAENMSSRIINSSVLIYLVIMIIAYNILSYLNSEAFNSLYEIVLRFLFF